MILLLAIGTGLIEQHPDEPLPKVVDGLQVSGKAKTQRNLLTAWLTERPDWQHADLPACARGHT